MVFGEPLSVKSRPLLNDSLFSSVSNKYSAYERNVSEKMISYWSNFIKYNRPSLQVEEWPQFNKMKNKLNRSIMFLNGSNSKVIDFALNDPKYLFWTG
jgi:carboxylesterase type B